VRPGLSLQIEIEAMAARIRSRYSGLKARARELASRFGNWNGVSFECPICGYIGPFRNVDRATGRRQHARCPKCGALERHRLQRVTMQNVVGGVDTSRLRMLHVAPESFTRDFFGRQFGKYVTADLFRDDVDLRVDLTALPFSDASYDCVFASHVLEHIKDDMRALQEISRVLKPGGLAVLPVPLVCERTIEYPEPNPNESYHVRAPGYDYYERYKVHFSRVDTYPSNAFPEKYQLFIYEDRSVWPTAECPLRPGTPGQRHIDIVPVCYA
jgi:SAM-dependent methyltransferase